MSALEKATKKREDVEEREKTQLPALERVRKLLREWEASYVDDVTPSGKGTHSQTVGIDDAINIVLAMVHSERSMTIPAAEEWKESIADVDDISAGSRRVVFGD